MRICCVVPILNLCSPERQSSFTHLHVPFRSTQGVFEIISPSHDGPGTTSMSGDWILVAGTESGRIWLLGALLAARGSGASATSAGINTADVTPRSYSGVDHSLVEVGWVDCPGRTAVANIVLLEQGDGDGMRLWISGEQGDSKVIRLMQVVHQGGDLEGDRESGQGWKILEDSSLAQMAIATDFAVVGCQDAEGSDDLDVVVCQGRGSHAYLRRVRGGLRVESHIESESGTSVDVSTYSASLKCCHRMIS